MTSFMMPLPGMNPGLMEEVRKSRDAAVDFVQPPPDAPPLELSAGPTGAPSVQMPRPEEAAMAATVPGVPAVPQAGLGGLDAQGRKIEQIGAGGMQVARDATQSLNDAAGLRASAATVRAGAERSAARQRGALADDELNQAVAYQERLNQVRKDEDEHVRQATQAAEEARMDARYAGIHSARRRELQAIIGNKAATPTQQASAQAELDKAQDVDPDQFLGSAGRKITAAIAMALGAYGSALSGGPNAAMQIIQQGIQENIDAQKANRASRERRAQQAREDVGAAAQQGQTEEARALTDYGVGLEMVKKKLAKIGAGLEGTEAGARLLELQAVNDEELAKNTLAIDRNARGDYLTAATERARLMATRIEMQDRRAAQAAGGTEGPKPMPAGGIQTLADAEAMLDQIGQLEQGFKDKTGAFSILTRYVPGTDPADYERARDRLAMQLTFQLSGAGASDKEREAIKGLIPSAATFSGSAGDLFNGLRAMTVAKIKATRDAHASQGYAPPQSSFDVEQRRKEEAQRIRQEQMPSARVSE
jgi:hypothetical protein